MSLQIKELPEGIISGITLINEGKFFQAHEILEAEWVREKSIIRHFYQGLIQVSVTLYHLEHYNWKGAAKVLIKAEENLIPFDKWKLPIDITQLLFDINRLEKRIYQLNKIEPSSQMNGIEFTIKMIKP